ncbi:MAG: hypothetical protein CMJ59_18000 [Planctomycetaceae bacterium]|nr:hypothetical protein [Planctomycetaceae bacterium]
MEFQKRQEEATFEVTAVNSAEHSTTIMAEGNMGRYGKVYVTFVLESVGDNTCGFLHGSGCGFLDEETMVSGNCRGVWRREGSKIVLHNTVNVKNGDQNFDVWVIDAINKTAQASVYALN